MASRDGSEGGRLNVIHWGGEPGAGFMELTTLTVDKLAKA